MAQPVRFVIADRDEATRKGLLSLFEAQESYKVVAETGEGESVPELVAEFRPDLVVLDSVDPVRPALAIRPELPILVLAMQASRQSVREALDAGARGYVLKSDPVTNLMEAVQRLLGGQSFISPSIRDLVSEAEPDRPRPPVALPLVPALRIYIAGYSRGRGIKIDFEPDPAFGRLAHELESTLMAVAQEAIVHVPSGAEKCRAVVRLTRSENSAFLELEAEGVRQSRNVAHAVRDAGASVGEVPEALSKNLESLEIYSTSYGTRLRASVPARRD